MPNTKGKNAALYPQKSHSPSILKGGVRPELLYRWKSEYSINNDNSFVGSGKRLESDDQVRLRQLEKENRELQEERDILKKALGIFSKKTR
jgi:transposase-like protein